MKKVREFFFLFLALPAGIGFISSPAASQDWSGFRGSDGNGSASPGGPLARTATAGLEVKWKRKLGSGYSSCVISGDLLVTMYSDGTDDLVVCLDKQSGETIWQTRIAPAFKGENGSFDGPISTPLIRNGYVYALDPSGELACLDLADGQTVWQRNLVETEKSVKPLYGFATSPVMAGGTLILQTGSPNGALAGLDPSTGETRWSATVDAINSQTPVVTSLNGQPVVIASGGKRVCVVNPETGSVLCEYEHGGGNGQATVPVVLPGDRVLLTLDDSWSSVVAFKPGEGENFLASEIWRHRSIKNTYNVPVLHEGNLFAFSTRVMTCVDPETGEPLWKSRGPGDGFLIAVDGHLIINTKEGDLVLARASAKSWEPVASVKLFEDRVWSLPAWNNQSIYCRSLGEIARVDVVSSDSRVETAAALTVPAAGRFAEFLSAVDAAGDGEKKGIVDQFMNSQARFPLVEGEIAHFVYRGPGEDVALAGDMFGARQEKKMQRVAGTDVFWLGLKLPPDQRLNYTFLVDYVPTPDARNDRKTTSSVYAGEMEFSVRLRNELPLTLSWFAMPKWKEPDYLAHLPEKLAGTLVKHSVPGADNKGGVEFDVYLPPGYESDADRRYPVFYVAGGPTTLSLGRMDKCADAIFVRSDKGIGPAIIVFANYPPMADFTKSFVGELVPSIDKAFRTIASREGRIVAGFGFFGGVMADIAAQHPGMFGGMAIYSPLMFDAARLSFVANASRIDQPMNVYLEWGRFDLFNPHENWDIRTIGEELAGELKKNSNIVLAGGMVNDSHDWSSWQNRFDVLLRMAGESSNGGKD